MRIYIKILLKSSIYKYNNSFILSKLQRKIDSYILRNKYRFGHDSIVYQVNNKILKINKKLAYKIVQISKIKFQSLLLVLILFVLKCLYYFSFSFL